MKIEYIPFDLPFTILKGFDKVVFTEEQREAFKKLCYELDKEIEKMKKEGLI